MTCKHCGAENRDEAVFCEHCKRQLIDPPFAPQEPVAPPAQPENIPVPPPYAPPVQNQYSNFPNTPPAPNMFNAPPAYNPYPPNGFNNFTNSSEQEHVSVGQWLGYFAINLIPCVGPLIYLAMLFVWGFGSTPKKSLRSFARAQLIILAVAFVLYAVIFAIMLAAGVSFSDMMDSYSESLTI